MADSIPGGGSDPMVLDAASGANTLNFGAGYKVDAGSPVSTPETAGEFAVGPGAALQGGNALDFGADLNADRATTNVDTAEAATGAEFDASVLTAHGVGEVAIGGLVLDPYTGLPVELGDVAAADSSPYTGYRQSAMQSSYSVAPGGVQPHEEAAALASLGSSFGHGA